MNSPTSSTSLLNVNVDNSPFTSPNSKKMRLMVDDFVIHTPTSTKNSIDQQIATYLYATNTPFQAVDHPEFRKLINMLRPGYQPPSRRDVAGRLLNDVHDSLLMKCQNTLQGQSVSMALDGWTNIKNEPVICICVTTPDGKTYPTMTINTSGNSHTAQYLLSVAKDAIRQAEADFKCKVKFINYFKMYNCT